MTRSSSALRRTAASADSPILRAGHNCWRVEAAAALGDLVRERWRCATGERLTGAPRGLDAWPRSLPPDFRDVEVGIARTIPAYDGQPALCRRHRRRPPLALHREPGALRSWLWPTAAAALLLAWLH